MIFSPSSEKSTALSQTLPDAFSSGRLFLQTMKDYEDRNPPRPSEGFLISAIEMSPGTTAIREAWF
jgi:hypothetical protein